MKDQLISIITPVKNGMPYFSECLASIANQTYQNIEHIISDGMSTDGTLALIERYSKTVRHKVICTSQKDSIGAANNRGISQSSGDVIGIICADDYYEDDAIAKVAEHFRNLSKPHVMYGDCNIVNSIGGLIRKYPARPFDLDDMVQNFINMVPQPSTFYSKEVALQIKYTEPRGSDYEFLIKAAEQFPIVYLPEHLANFRIHSTSQTMDWQTTLQTLKEDYLCARANGCHLLSQFSYKYYKLMLREVVKAVLFMRYWRN